MVPFTRQVAEIFELVEVIRKYAYDMNRCVLQLDKDNANKYFVELQKSLKTLNTRISDLNIQNNDYNKENEA